MKEKKSKFYHRQYAKFCKYLCFFPSKKIYELMFVWIIRICFLIITQNFYKILNNRNMKKSRELFGLTMISLVSNDEAFYLAPETVLAWWLQVFLMVFYLRQMELFVPYLNVTQNHLSVKLGKLLYDLQGHQKK